MSLKSRKSIDSVGPDYHEEVSVTFRRDPDKTYTKITTTLRRDRKTGQIKEMKRIKPVEDGPFEITNELAGYDEKMQYQDQDGNDAFIFLKRVNKDESG